MKTYVNQIVLYKEANCQVKTLNPSGSVTIEFRTACPPYKVGDKVVVMPYDLKPFGL